MRNFSFNLGDGQTFSMPTPPDAPNAPMVFFNRRAKLGLQVEDLEQGKGVKVKDVDEDSPASKAGLKEGDVITEVNGKDVAGVDEIRTAIRDVKDGDTVRLKYKRGNNTQTVEVKIPKKLRSADL
jgi:serine protease Do